MYPFVPPERRHTRHTYTIHGVSYVLSQLGSLILACDQCGEEHFREPENYFWSTIPENAAWLARGQKNYWGDPSWHTCDRCLDHPPLQPLRVDELKTKWWPLWHRLGWFPAEDRRKA